VVTVPLSWPCASISRMSNFQIGPARKGRPFFVEANLPKRKMFSFRKGYRSSNPRVLRKVGGRIAKAKLSLCWT
jgi:hypothetical protein